MIEKEFCQLIGSVSRDFRPPFFNDSNPFGPLINRLKYFRMRFRFRRDFRSQSQPHAGKVFYLSLRCVEIFDHKVNHMQVKFSICLCSVLHTAEIISALCCTPQRLSPWCVAHRSDHIRGILHTTEIFFEI